MADGTLRFDTEIDESGFQKGLKRIEQAAKGATQQTASDAQDAAKQACLLYTSPSPRDA